MLISITMIEEIIALKKERHAVILAHNYQIPAVQDVADLVGDSLELSRAAANLDAEVIVFCGVDFMAETAAILSPQKKVVLPEKGAWCPMAHMIAPDQLRDLKSQNPRSCGCLLRKLHRRGQSRKRYMLHLRKWRAGSKFPLGGAGHIRARQEPGCIRCPTY